MTEKTCQRCGDPFVDRSPVQKARFCSDNCRKRAHEYEHNRAVRATCETCGGLCGIGSASGPPSRQCLACRHAARLEKAQTIARLWAQGASMREIATALGWTMGHLHGEMGRIREDGLADLPYRYNIDRREAAQRGRRARQEQAA
jgi:hypothetical protein